jgi:hypothetical protein
MFVGEYVVVVVRVLLVCLKKAQMATEEKQREFILVANSILVLKAKATLTLWPWSWTFNF